jgi:glycosyltransferase involved in cell wall biosynthesis
MFYFARPFAILRRIVKKFLQTFLGGWRPSGKKIVGLVPVRNERRVLPQYLRTLSLYTDAIVFLDDASEDDSVEVVESLAAECRVERILRNKTWHFDEPVTRNRLLEAGRSIGGTHFIVLDADELFTANCLEGGFLRRTILDLKPGDVLEMNWIQLWRSTARYRFDQSVWTWNMKDFVFCDDGQAGYESDFIHCPRTPPSLAGARHRIEGYDRGVMHFQFVHWRNLLVKQAWYRCLERIRQPQKPPAEINRVYAGSVDETGLGVRPSPASWFAGYPSFDPSIYSQPDIAREQEVLGWFEKHGREYFRDLAIWDIDWGVPQPHPGPCDAVAPAFRPRGARRLRWFRPLVSAIVSTYNAERFMRGKLEDLEAQTLAGSLEIIVVDSGSSENERSIVEQFQARYANIRYVRTARETVYQAWNRGIRMARGRYVTNANTDDRLRPDCIEVLVRALERDSGAVLAYGDSLVTLEENETFAACTIDHVLRWPDFCYVGPHPVWRKAIHDVEGYFDESYRCAADYEFWLRLAMKHRFIHIAQPLGLYWQNEGTVSRKGDDPLREAAQIQDRYRKSRGAFAGERPRK